MSLSEIHTSIDLKPVFHWSTFFAGSSFFFGGKIFDNGKRNIILC